MRAIIISHAYVDPATRGKLRTLVGLGCAVGVAVPERWARPGTGQTVRTTWGDDAGVRVCPIPVGGDLGRPGTARWSRSAIRRLLTDFGPDIVQVEEEPWSRAASAAVGAAARLRLPTTLFTWESVPRSYSTLVDWRRGRTLRRVAGLIGGNRMAATLVGKARPEARLAVIPQFGVTPPLQVSRDEHSGLAIGFIGRLMPEKGLDILFRACVKLLGPWTLTIVGSGPAQEELEGLAERLGIAARVNWMGAVPPPELERLWPSLDCVVFPSRTTQRWVETFNPALIEAMGHGVAVIGSESGALPEMIDTAGLVVPEDEVGSLTAALQHLSDAPRERQRLGKEGRQRVMTEYVDEAVAQKTLVFWDSIVRTKR